MLQLLHVVKFDQRLWEYHRFYEVQIEFQKMLLLKNCRKSEDTHKKIKMMYIELHVDLS